MAEIDPVLNYANESIKKGSKSFYLAGSLLAPKMRERVFLLYAWCRYCDDVTDDQESGLPTTRGKTRSVEDLKTQSLKALHQVAELDLPFLALGKVARETGLTEQMILDHLAGFELDQKQTLYQNQEALFKYCFHVAGAVGILMAKIMGASTDDSLKRASDLGIAFQLTNIARDIVADAKEDRFYVPEDWLSEANLTKKDLREATQKEAIYGLAKRLVETAEPYYQAAFIGLWALPPRCAWAIASALRIYREIGRRLVKQGSKSVGTRVFVSKPRQLVLALQALGDLFLRLTIPQNWIWKERRGLWDFSSTR